MTSYPYMVRSTGPGGRPKLACLVSSLEGGASFYENSVLRAYPGPHHHRGRRRQAQGARTGHDGHGDGGKQGEQERVGGRASRHRVSQNAQPAWSGVLGEEDEPGDRVEWSVLFDAGRQAAGESRAT